MRVLSIVPTFHPSVGGLERVVQELAVQVRAHDVEMDVAHVATDHRRLSEERVDALRVFRVPLTGHRLLGYAPALRDLARPYDLLHVHDPQLLALTASVRMACADKPAVLSTHGGFWHTRRFAWFKQAYEHTLLDRAIDHYRLVLASSGGDLDYFRTHAPRAELCANGVDVRRFAGVSAKRRDGPLHRWIYWGRLSSNKRVDLAIEAVATARALGHPVDLLVCGRDFDGLLPSLHEQVRGLSLEHVVRFEPYLDDAALVDELSRRDVFVTASEHEGFGLGIVEAMAAGLVVLCRDMPPLDAFVRDGRTGFFLRFDGGADDREALSLLLDADAAAAASLSARARATAAEHDWSIAAGRFASRYRAALDA